MQLEPSNNNKNNKENQVKKLNENKKEKNVKNIENESQYSNQCIFINSCNLDDLFYSLVSEIEKQDLSNLCQQNLINKAVNLYPKNNFKLIIDKFKDKFLCVYLFTFKFPKEYNRYLYIYNPKTRKYVIHVFLNKKYLGNRIYCTNFDNNSLLININNYNYNFIINIFSKEECLSFKEKEIIIDLFNLLNMYNSKEKGAFKFYQKLIKNKILISLHLNRNFINSILIHYLSQI
jgi:hypothetical protein